MNLTTKRRSVTGERQEFSDSLRTQERRRMAQEAGRESLRLTVKKKRSGRAAAGVRQEAVGQGGNWKGKSVIKDRTADNLTSLLIIRGLFYCLHCV